MRTSRLRSVKSSLWSLYRYLAIHTRCGQKVADFSFHLSIERRRNELKERLISKLGYKVTSGPFSGLILPPETSWADGDVIAKLLGCYEEELQPSILQTVERQPQLIINIGCAEGYYAVGLARIVQCPVYAIDIDSKALEVCAICARTNGVADRLHLSNDSSPEAIRELTKGRRGFLLIDCEGAEAEILTQDLIDSLGRCDLIIESHDFKVPGELSFLRQSLLATHDITVINEGSRDPNRYEHLTPLPSLDRWLAISEGRPETMSWVICLARQ